jgi:hypothetical protein
MREQHTGRPTPKRKRIQAESSWRRGKAIRAWPSAPEDRYAEDVLELGADGWSRRPDMNPPTEKTYCAEVNRTPAECLCLFPTTQNIVLGGGIQCGRSVKKRSS